MFSKKVSDFVDSYTGAEKDLARSCEVGLSTVKRWSQGRSIPGVHTQKFVLEKISKLWTN